MAFFDKLNQIAKSATDIANEAIDSGMDAGGVGGVFLEVAEQGFELGVVEGSGFVLNFGEFAPIVERVSCGLVIETHFEKVVE